MRSWASPYDRFLYEGSWFATRVRKWLESSSVSSDVIFSYDTTALEIFELAKRKDYRCVLGQIDPGRVEAEIVSAERERWPDWEPFANPIPEVYHERRMAEWALADRIIVNSQWSFDALVRQGVPVEKLVIIPLCYEPSTGVSTPVNGRDRRLQVLWLGQVNLRKGIPYLIDAAKLLEEEPVDIHVVGPIQISTDAVKPALKNLTFHGPVSRQEAVVWYQKADVFVLPTLSDGFAITQLEAMAYGLPVIATPNCGDVINPGSDGFIVPPRDAKSLAERICKLANDEEMRRQMSENALRTSRSFSLQELAQSLAQLDDELTTP